MDWYDIQALGYMMLVFGIASVGVWALPWKDDELEATVEACIKMRNHMRELRKRYLK